MVVVVKVPVVREVFPRGGDIVAVVRPPGFVFFVCLGLVFQDLQDEGGVGFRRDEDGWHL